MCLVKSTQKHSQVKKQNKPLRNLYFKSFLNSSFNKQSTYEGLCWPDSFGTFYLKQMHTSYSKLTTLYVWKTLDNKEIAGSKECSPNAFCL